MVFDEKAGPCDNLQYIINLKQNTIIGGANLEMT